MIGPLRLAPTYRGNAEGEGTRSTRTPFPDTTPSDTEHGRRCIDPEGCVGRRALTVRSDHSVREDLPEVPTDACAKTPRSISTEKYAKSAPVALCQQDAKGGSFRKNYFTHYNASCYATQMTIFGVVSEPIAGVNCSILSLRELKK